MDDKTYAELPQGFTISGSRFDNNLTHDTDAIPLWRPVRLVCMMSESMTADMVMLLIDMDSLRQ